MADVRAHPPGADDLPPEPPAPDWMRPLPLPPVVWRLREALYVLGAVIAAGPVVLVLLALGVVPMPEDGNAAVFWGAVTFVYYGLPVVVMSVFAHDKPGGMLPALGFRGTRFGWVLGGGSLALLVVTAFNLVYSVFMMLVGLGPPESSMRVMDELARSIQAGPLQMLVTILLIVVVAPVVEEAIFRGVVLNGLASRFGAWPAIAVTSVVFAAVHLDLWRSVPLAFLGAVLGALAWWTRSIWPAVLAHALVNGFAFLIATLSVSAS